MSAPYRCCFMIRPKGGGQAPLSSMENWQRVEVGDYEILADHGLPLEEIPDGDGGVGGWLLGWKFPSQWPLSVPADFTEARQAAIEGGGRYLLVGLSKEGLVLTPDPGASLACQFDVDRREVIGSNWLLHEIHRSDWDHEYFEVAEKITHDGSSGKSGNWFAGGLSFVRGFRCLLPNHELLLDQGRTERCWPLNEDELKTTSETSTLLDEAAIALRDATGDFLAHRPSMITVTAGRDSRAVLAAVCANPGAPRPLGTTIGAKESLDANLALSLCELSGLEHHFTSGAHEPEERCHDLACLTGFGGELFRGFYYVKGRDLPTLGIDELLDVLYYHSDTSDQRIREAVAEWLEAVPSFLTRTQVLDLVFLELRQGVVASQSLYLRDLQFAYSTHPFSSRACVRLALRLDPDFKASDRFGVEIVNRLAPKLNLLPYSATQHAGLSKYRAWIQWWRLTSGERERFFPLVRGYFSKWGIAKMVLADLGRVGSRLTKRHAA